MNLNDDYSAVRRRTEWLCRNLETEDYVVQPVADVSPPKWHLGHTTWFFETFVLIPNLPGYREFHPDFSFVFNSYYESLGSRVIRADRGNLSRPTVQEIFRYRKYVDDAMTVLLTGGFEEHVGSLVILGLNHEQQHQELLSTDIKYILGHNPLFPGYERLSEKLPNDLPAPEFVRVGGGMYDIGHDGRGFCFDNETARHQVYLDDFEISSRLVNNAQYLEFMQDGGYESHQFWHADGLEWVRSNQIKSPLYWHRISGEWYNYTSEGLKPLSGEKSLCHISFYEASAFAAWSGMRLPTEFEWEAAAPGLDWSERWEWTNSAYLPYPGFRKQDGAIGEYNGKFMVNQMVLRGASEVTPAGHSRITYRNFFYPGTRWQYSGIRLAR